MSLVDKFGDLLGKLLGGLDECATNRCAPSDRKQLRLEYTSSDAALENSRAARGLSALTPSPQDERWSFFKGGDSPKQRILAHEDDLSNASTQSLERFSLPCRASSIKRVSWNHQMCTEAGKLFTSPHDPALPENATPPPSSNMLRSCCRSPRASWSPDESPPTVRGLRKGIELKGR
mmetsp:Transcript_1275/g.3823  ORF Transcript_1275/g.3823 Transcript_1275/m.3823 type:complete len:177 (+) Transcript_1275:45-575(+)